MTDTSQESLEFQDFSHASSAPRDSSGQLGAPIGGTAPLLAAEEGRATPAASTFSCWDFRYYQQWFNVDTADVMSRIGFSTVPISNKFFDKVNGNPDLYGPVWISSTVVFMLAATGNFANWLQFVRKMGMNASGWTYDFTTMTFGASLIYSYAFLLPLGVYAALRYAGSRLSLTDIICLYGYSLFIYIPASILCIPPSAGVQWTVVVIAGLASTIGVVRSLSYEIGRDQANAKVTTPLLMVVGLLSIGLAMILKLFLFQNADFGDLIEIAPGNTMPVATPVGTTLVVASPTEMGNTMVSSDVLAMMSSHTDAHEATAAAGEASSQGVQEDVTDMPELIEMPDASSQEAQEVQESQEPTEPAAALAEPAASSKKSKKKKKSRRRRRVSTNAQQ